MAPSVRRAPATAASTIPPARPTSTARTIVAPQRRRSSARARAQTAAITAPLAGQRRGLRSRPEVADQRRDGLADLIVGHAAVAHPGDPAGGCGDLLVVGDQQDGLP